MPQGISYRGIVYDKPKVFVSYRWGEYENWVEKFSGDLTDKGVDVIHDRTVRRAHPDEKISNFIIRLMKGMESSHAFIPIFTPGYLERIKYPRPSTPTPDGFVLDEFQLSLGLARKREIETIAVLKEGSFDNLPKPFNQENSLDMRDDKAYEGNINILTEYLFFHRVIKQKNEYY
jgi:hypothetical protein